MNTTDKRNIKLNGDLKNENSGSNRTNTPTNEELFNLDKIRRAEDNNREIANRGYTIRDGHNPNKPNPDEKDFIQEDDLDTLDDDFHTDRDLEDNNDDIYEVELEEGEVKEGEVEDQDDDLDIDGNLNEVNDELDNPSDDFNETEEDLEDLDQDDDENEEEYIEDDVQEEDPKRD